MRNDRLRKDEDDIQNLDDLIEARNEETSHFARDHDSLEVDIDIRADADVEDALTFPHPRSGKEAGHPGIMDDTPHGEEMEDDQDQWRELNMLPSDYSDDYDDALTVFPTDDEDEIVEDQIRDISRMRMGDMSDEPPIERMPNVFTPDGATRRVEDTYGSPDPEEVGLILAEKHTEEESAADAGESTEQIDRD